MLIFAPVVMYSWNVRLIIFSMLTLILKRSIAVTGSALTSLSMSR